MRHHLIIKPSADEDILRIAQWYDIQKAGLGLRFLDDLEAKFEQIQSGPSHYQVRYKGVRFAILRYFPCSVHFTVEGDKIFILAVFGDAQDPSLWK